MIYLGKKQSTICNETLNGKGDKIQDELWQIIHGTYQFDVSFFLNLKIAFAKNQFSNNQPWIDCPQ